MGIDMRVSGYPRANTRLKKFLILNFKNTLISNTGFYLAIKNFDIFSLTFALYIYRLITGYRPYFWGFN